VGGRIIVGRNSPHQGCSDPQGCDLAADQADAIASCGSCGTTASSPAASSAAIAATLTRPGRAYPGVASGAGTGQFTTVPLSGGPVRYVRITLTAASGSWFSVADVRAYTGGPD
jgi:hypothetical protein